jgi:hypothetical protein
METVERSTRGPLKDLAKEFHAVATKGSKCPFKWRRFLLCFG